MRHMSLDRCEGCGLKPALCVCALLPHIRTRTHVVVVMHKLEARKSTNTGRLAVRSLVNAELALLGGDPPLAERPWPADHTPAVLFPVAGAQPVVELRGIERLALVALDANWRQAARMRKRFALQGIPFVRAPDGPSTYRLRNGPHADGMSTLEAIARSLAALEDVDVEPMLRALAVFQDRTLWLRGTKKRDAVTGGIPDGVFRHQR